MKSLRLQMLHQDPIALQGAEAFGQEESLTQRLRHVLDLYPEGNGIVYELLQNADDAGARTVKVVLSRRHFASTSLIGPKMEDWQGPALYFVRAPCMWAQLCA